MSTSLFGQNMGLVTLMVALLLLAGAGSTTEAADAPAPAPLTAKEVVVGGSVGWNVPHNPTYYADWIKGFTFHVGDTLRFNWTGTHTVANVSKADYDGCNTKVSVLKSSAGPPGISGNLVNYSITKPAETLYFICTVGPHCLLGQKVSVHVEAGGGAAGGPPSGGETPSPKSSAPLVSLGALSATLSIWAFFLFVF